MQIEPMRITDHSVPVVVLVSSQHGGVGIIRSLGRQGVPVYGVHQDRWEPSARSRYLRGVSCWDFAAASADDSIAFLRLVARQVGGRPMLVATSDVTAVFLAQNAEALAAAYRFATPSAEVVETFASKKLTFDLCRKLNIPTAELSSPHSRNDIRDFVANWRLPVIVKGANGEFLDSRGKSARVVIATQESEVLEIFARNEIGEILLQEFIPGGDDTIWMFNGYFDEHSDCLFGATGRKLRQFPVHRGSTSLGICEPKEEVEAQTLRLMRAVDYRGLLDLGFRYDARDRQYKLLDVNPRIGATFRLFVAENGLDVARALYLDLTGQSIPRSQVSRGRKWMVETNDLVSCAKYFREGQLTPLQWLRSLRGVEEGVWAAADDLAPLATLPLLWLRKKFRRNATARASEFAPKSPVKEIAA